MSRRIAQNERGTVVLFVALMMPVILAVIAVVVDVGLLYVQQARLQSSTDLAAAAGASLIGDAATTAAQELIDAGASPDSSNPFYYLSATEVEQVADDTSVTSIIELYLDENNTPLECVLDGDDTDECAVRVQWQEENERIALQVDAYTTVTPVFAALLGGERRIQVQSVSTISTNSDS